MKHVLRNVFFCFFEHEQINGGASKCAPFLPENDITCGGHKPNHADSNICSSYYSIIAEITSLHLRCYHNEKSTNQIVPCALPNIYAHLRNWLPCWGKPLFDCFYRFSSPLLKENFRVTNNSETITKLYSFNKFASVFNL